LSRIYNLAKIKMVHAVKILLTYKTELKQKQLKSPRLYQN